MGTTIAQSTDARSGLRKAAILLINLGDDVGSQVIRQLSDAELRKITQEVTQLGTVPQAEAEKVMEEFCRSSATVNMQGGKHRAQRMLELALGAEPARRVLEEVSNQTEEQQPKAGFQALQEADPKQLANFIETEHPQTIALILSNMKAEPAGAVLMALPAEVRPTVVRRLGKLDEVSPQVLTRLANVMGDKLRSFGKIQTRVTGGPRAVADLLNHIDQQAGDEILREVTKVDTGLADSVRDLMFVFEDVLRIDKEGIKALLGAVDRKALTIALKGTSDALKQHFLQCMSQRAATMLGEDMEALGPVRLRDVDVARKEIITTLKKLQEAGTISLQSGGGDQYVQ